MQQIHIANVGPIEHLDIPLPEEGGVVVLRGRNGRGKSTALAAVTALNGGKPLLTPRHGMQYGTIEAPGIVLRIGQRTTQKGELTVHQIEASAPALLVDPGIKDTDRADAARSRALCQILGIRPAREAWAKLLLDPSQIDEAMAGADHDDAPKCAAQVKRFLEEQARWQEQVAERDTERSKAQRVAAEDAVRGVQDYPGDAQQDAVASAGDLKGLEAQRQTALAALQRLPGVRAELAAIEGLSVDQAQQEVDRHAARLTGAKEAMDAAKAALEAAKLDVLNATNGLERAQGNLKIAQARGPLASQVANLEAQAAGCPTEEAIAEARAKLEAAKAGMAAQEMGKRAKGYEDQALALERSAREASEKAKDLRDRAAQVEPVLFTGLASELVAVRDGLLYGRHHSLGMVRFGSLSHGERWRLALELVVANSTEGTGTPVLSAPQEAWEGLDPENRAELVQIAKDAGVVILTAEADSGELTAATA